MWKKVKSFLTSPLYKAAHKVSSLKLKAFKSYPIIKNDISGWVEWVVGVGKTLPQANHILKYC